MYSTSQAGLVTAHASDHKVSSVLARVLSERHAPEALGRGTGDVRVQHSGGSHMKRSRRIWALKRSPHIFSKSQESFRHESYSSRAVLTGSATTLGVAAHLVVGPAIWWNRSCLG